MHFAVFLAFKRFGASVELTLERELLGNLLLRVSLLEVCHRHLLLCVSFVTELALERFDLLDFSSVV